MQYLFLTTLFNIENAPIPHSTIAHYHAGGTLDDPYSGNVNIFLNRWAYRRVTGWDLPDDALEEVEYVPGLWYFWAAYPVTWDEGCKIAHAIHESVCTCQQGRDYPKLIERVLALPDAQPGVRRHRGRRVRKTKRNLTGLETDSRNSNTPAERAVVIRAHNNEIRVSMGLDPLP